MLFQRKGILILVLLLLTGLYGCGLQDDFGGQIESILDFSLKKEPQYENTVMVYMVGSNLESESGAASMDILEMAESGIDLTKNRVVIYAGGSQLWQIGIPSSQNTILELTENDPGLEIRDAVEGSPNMGEASTFADFIDYCVKNYPSAHYGLICWDHGGGPVGGFGNDELYQYDSLTLEEISSALEMSVLAKSAKLDWIGYDACLMASIEVADVWDGYADYMISSQETEPGCGWDYSFLSVLNETSDARAISKKIIDTYEKFFSENQSVFFNPDFTLSCIDLAGITNTTEALDQLFARMKEDLDDGAYIRLAQSRESVKEYGETSAADRGDSLDLIDLYDMAEKLKERYPLEAKELQEQLDKLIVYETSNIAGASGVSIYYPYNNKEYFTVAGQRQVQTAAGLKEYKNYVEKFSEIWLSEETDPISWKNTVRKMQEKEFTLELTDEQLANLSEAYYTILWEIGEDEYIPVFSHCALTPDEEGVLHVNLDQDVFFMKTDTDEDMIVWPVQQVECREDKTIYKTQKTGLENLYSTIDDPDGVAKYITVSFSVDNKSDEAITQKIEEGWDEQIVGKSDVDPGKYGAVYFTWTEIVPSFDAQNQMLPYTEWDDNGNMIIVSMSYDKQFQFIRQSLRMGEGHYICQIVLKDTKGNAYASECVDLPSAEEAGTAVEQPTGKGVLRFVCNEDHAELVAYEGEDEELTVPEQIRQLPVTVIENNVFKDQKTIRKIDLPDTVEAINASAFEYCTVLEEIRLPKGLQNLSEKLFLGCRSLQSITLPASLHKIGFFAFDKCSSLQSITLPPSVAYVGAGAFAECSKLKGIEVDGHCKNYRSENGVLFSGDGNILVAFPGGFSGDYRIPENVEEIEDYAFAGATLLTNAVMPETLKKIGVYAFYDCFQFQNIQLSDSVEMIGSKAFANSLLTMLEDRYLDSCYKPISEIYIGKSVSWIGRDAFEYCDVEKYVVSEENDQYSSKDGFLLNKLQDALILSPYFALEESVTLPEGIKTVEEAAFEGLGQVEELVLPDSLISISRNAGLSNGLKKIVIGKNLIDLGSVTMYSGIEEIEVSEENRSFKMQDQVLFDREMKTLLMYPAANVKTETEYQIPNGVTQIGAYAFAYNDNLKKLSIPASLEGFRTEGTHAGNLADLNMLNGLEEVVVDDKNPIYSSDNGLLYSKDGSSLLLCPPAKEGVIEIKAGTNTIEEYAFDGNYLSADKVILPEGAEILKGHNFSNMDTCQVYLPDSMMYISEASFVRNGDGVEIHCSKGSVADLYAKKKKIAVIYDEQE